MELSEAISILKHERKITELYGHESCITNIEAIDTVLKALDNSISKDEVINKMEELNKLIKNAEPIEAVFMIKQQQALDELLRGE